MLFDLDLGPLGMFAKPLVNAMMNNWEDVATAMKFMNFMLIFCSIVVLGLLYFACRHVLYTLGKKTGDEDGWHLFL